MKKLLSIILGISMAITLCAVPKVSVKAVNDEVEPRISTTIPVSVEVEKRVTFSDGYMLFVGKMTGTMVRGSDRKVISYDVDLSSSFIDGEKYYPKIISKTTTVTKSGYGIIGKIVIKYDLMDYLDNTVATNKTLTIEIPCGV